MRATHFIIPAVFLFTNAIADNEPNNTWQTATTLAKGATVVGTQSDDDWYVINATGGQRLLIDLTFTHADGNIQMTFFDDGNVAAQPPPLVPGTLRTAGTGNTTDHEFLDHSVPAGPGGFYIKVYGGGSPQGNQGNSYTLTWSELTTADDDYEMNNTNADVKAITAASVVFGSQSDEDWYSIEVTPGNERVLASVRFNNTELATTIDLDLELRDPGGTLLASSLNASGLNEAINYVVAAAGIYHLRVLGDNNADGYALTWDSVAPASSVTFPAPAATVAPAAPPSPPAPSSSSSGSLAPVLVFALLITGVLRRKLR